MLSLNCLILNGTKYVLDRQCCSIIEKQIKLRVICLLWKSALVGGCFSLDLGQLIVVDSQKYENLPNLSKQHMIIRHQQQIVRFTHKTFCKIWAKNKLKIGFQFSEKLHLYISFSFNHNLKPNFCFNYSFLYHSFNHFKNLISIAMTHFEPNLLRKHVTRRKQLPG